MTFRLSCFFLISVVAFVCHSSAQLLLNFHSDITFSYDTSAGDWSTYHKHGGSFDNPNVETPFNEGSYPARDLAGPLGERFSQPPLSSFDFTGVPDGQPIWKIDQQDIAETWPGFRSEQAPGTLRAYDPNDSRLSALTDVPSQRWVKVELTEMDYVGASSDPQFSLWFFANGTPTVWMATSDGIYDPNDPNETGTPDAYFVEENGHRHVTYGFSSLGLYRIYLRASAILDSTGDTVVSDPEPVTFAIGTKATWLSSYFNGDQLFTESASGDESDEDSDGIKLLLEYAFNLSPVEADTAVLVPGTGTSGLPHAALVPDGQDEALQIEFIRRKASTNPQITYHAEFKDELGPGQWDSSVGEQVSSINATWERVIVKDSVNTSASGARFARVRVEMQDTISY